MKKQKQKPLTQQTFCPDVGRSNSRTPFKHFLLDALLGREAGVYAYGTVDIPAIPDPWHVIDMNAGDASSDGFGGRSSPEIIWKHASWARERGVPVRVTFIEKALHVYDLLCENRPPSNEVWAEYLHQDSRDYRIPKKDEQQAIFVHSDPNSLGDWCITPELVATFSETTTMLVTLGCNVGGLKRLPQSERRVWFDHVRALVDVMPSYHDAILVTITRHQVDGVMRGDPSQWAYLIRTAKKWTDRTIDTAKKGAGRCELEIAVASYLKHHHAFEAIQRDLFLTRSEKAG